MTVVHVTRAQVLAARLIVKLAQQRGLPVRPAVQRIADATMTNGGSAATELNRDTA